LPETPTTEISDLLAAYALGALEPDERDFIARNLPRHPAWQSELEGYRAAAEALAYAPQELEVPLRVRAAVLAAVDAIESNIPLSHYRKVAWNATLPAVPVSDQLQASRNWRRTLPKIALVMSMPATLVAIVFAMYTVIIHNQYSDQQDELAKYQQAQDESAEVLTSDSTSRQVVDLVSSSDAPFARGNLFIDRSDNAAMLVVRDLPELDAEQVYVVWVGLDSGNREYARIGVLQPNDAGTAQFVFEPFDAFEHYTNLVVTKETDPDVAVPTGAEIMTGGIP
jgi:hypothetical protein